MAVPLGVAAEARAHWRGQPPGEGDADLGPYLRRIGGCNDCHGNAQPRPTAISTATLALPATGRPWQTCRAAPRLQALSSTELAAILAN